jgi:nucleotide-binding universal stress UspA family protein
MFHRIAVAYDESPEAEYALRTGIELAKSLDAELLTITVAEDLPAYTAYAAGADASMMRTLRDDKARSYEELRAKAMRLALLRGMMAVSELIDGETVEAISSFVRVRKVDLLVVGLHHRSSRLARIWSTVYSLAQDVPCCVLGVH